LLAAESLSAGRIVALKGIGGFQLLVEAGNEEAVCRLRSRKRREERPFAVMYPSLQQLRGVCSVSAMEEELLTSPEAPIVLLERKPDLGRIPQGIAPSVAPGHPCMGVMLPYSPLHHLLMREVGHPIVVISGNAAGEPGCIDEHEALERLGGIADLFVVHNRPIVRQLDDSVARAILGGAQVLRRARGYAPLPIQLKERLPTVLGVGAHLGNAVALSIGNQVFLSQHIGDLQTESAQAAFRRAAADLPRACGAAPDLVACDLHPAYFSTKFALEHTVPLVPVQHHYAHVLACMAENQTAAPALGVSWDGTGLGPDGSIWGGEFLLIGPSAFERAAHLRPFHLPGGDEAVLQPRRSALGVLFEMFGPELFSMGHEVLLRHFTGNELTLLRRMLTEDVNAPPTSSTARLFDAAAALVGLRQRTTFEGQSAMEFESIIRRGVDDIYPFGLEAGACLQVDWRPMMRALLDDVWESESIGIIAARFHNTLAAMLLSVARCVGEPRVLLTGSCFQNRYLTERCVRLLEADGFGPAWHRQVPPNDGGIALGQVLAAARTQPARPTPEELLPWQPSGLPELGVSHSPDSELEPTVALPVTV
jgi:hydrogenase maturation protein HypF